MEVDDVELVGTPPYLIEHQDIVRHRFFDGRIQSERYVTAAHQFRLCDGISRGEQSDIVTLPDKFLGQVRDDPFGASIEFGGTRSAKGATWAIFIATTSSSERSIDNERRAGPARRPARHTTGLR